MTGGVAAVAVFGGAQMLSRVQQHWFGWCVVFAKQSAFAASRWMAVAERVRAL